MKLDFHNGRVVEDEYTNCHACDASPLFDDYDYCPYCGAKL
jgi:rRNA maturation endonuclease Nob1